MQPRSWELNWHTRLSTRYSSPESAIRIKRGCAEVENVDTDDTLSMPGAR